ncbi:MAG: GntR family transcriptional regulator [Roseibium sp.]|uniref:GntR family transcriptional regulator n=1 Tax=Roseibium sp. TaxID=1936156 RepID=UPI00262811B9|nr:GntR family transcriptional regulator [Roseibium sp.]MCV0427558.1 GntR family transcriptional regulator [Roseibium sp.]
MSEAKKDTQRATAAATAIVDNRGTDDASSIMVTLEHAVAAVLIAVYRDHRMAAGVLNEGLVQGVEQRIASHAAKSDRGNHG